MRVIYFITNWLSSNHNFSTNWIFLYHSEVLYILTSVWVLLTPNTGRNLLFQHLLCKKLKKEEKARFGSSFFTCFHLILPVSKKNEKKIEKWQKAYFDQQTLCAAPICWVKNTTRNWYENYHVFLQHSRQCQRTSYGGC